MSKGKNQHIVPHPKGWAVQPEGGSKPTQVFKTQKEAIKKGRKIAINQKSELLIHDEKNQIRERNSYGNDPSESKG